MSNPITLVEPFNGSLGSLTGVQPIRYNGGLWLEAAGTNLHTNPVAKSNGTRWGAYGGSGARNTGIALVHPETGATYTTGWRTDFANGNQNAVAATILGTWSAGQYLAASALVKASGTMVGKNIRLRLAFNGGSQATAFSTQVLVAATGSEQIVTITAPLDYSDRTFVDLVVGHGGTIAAGTDILETTAVQFEDGQVRSSFIYGSTGSGYAFAGSADASTSTRAAPSASISPTGILSPSAGAIAMRIAPTIETGLEEIWGECGTKGSGTDHVRWGRDASRHPFVEWSSNDAAYQRLTSDDTADAEVEHFMFIGHDGTNVYIKAAGGTTKSGSRDAVEDDFSTGDLELQASAGGVIFHELAMFSEMLGPEQVAKLENTQNWSMNTLGGSTIIMPLTGGRRPLI